MYSCDLIGGASLAVLERKYAELCAQLSNTKLIMAHPDVDAAYLTSRGLVAVSKRQLAEQLKIELRDLELLSPSTGFSMG